MGRYAETRDASAELLRLVIPHMSKAAAPFHPLSYAVWYEYSSQTNPALREAVDKAMAAGDPFEDARIEEIHERYIARGEGAGGTKAHSELDRLAREVLEEAKSAGAEAGRYNESLGAAGAKLRDGVDAGALAGVIQSLVIETQRMRESTTAMQGRLEESTREIAGLRADLSHARSEALVDPLTGIANRRGLERAVRALDEEAFANACVIALDIDHFKKCNDSYGHLFGDRVIAAVAKVLVANVKGKDSPARIGGEEFVVLLPDTPLEGAQALAERIRSTIEGGRIRRGESGELIGNITVSLGVAARQPMEPFESLLERADEALYHSKRTGRNRVSVASRGGQLAAAA